jgi:predicted RNA-binding protein YlxR (DUF448 family)
MVEGQVTPIRTCAGCRQRAGKPELLRAVVDGDRIRLDPEMRLPGRGVYLHRAAACIEAAGRGGLSRSLRRRLSRPALERFRDAAMAASAGPQDLDRATKEGQS